MDANLEIAFLLSFCQFLLRPFPCIHQIFWNATEGDRVCKHYKLMEWREIGQFADMRRWRVAGIPDASTCVRHAFKLHRQADDTPPDMVWVCVSVKIARTVFSSVKIAGVYSLEYLDNCQNGDFWLAFRESPTSNPPCYRFKVWPFPFSSWCPSLLTCI